MHHLCRLAASKHLSVLSSCFLLLHKKLLGRWDLNSQNLQKHLLPWNYSENSTITDALLHAMFIEVIGRSWRMLIPREHWFFYCSIWREGTCHNQCGYTLNCCTSHQGLPRTIIGFIEANFTLKNYYFSREIACPGYYFLFP